MKKNIEWLKVEVQKRIDNIPSTYDGSYIEGRRDAYELVLQDINKLDEPEVLSWEWIHENKEMYLINDTSENAVPDYKLQNLLVPKQEELESKIKVLIEAYKQEEDAYSNPENGWISGFVEDLENLVEEEQKYYVLDKEDATLLKKSAAGEGVAKSVGTNIYNVKSWKDEEKYQLTEQEIKNYDERFWPFAEPVE